MFYNRRMMVIQAKKDWEILKATTLKEGDAFVVQARELIAIIESAENIGNYDFHQQMLEKTASLRSDPLMAIYLASYQMLDPDAEDPRAILDHIQTASRHKRNAEVKKAMDERRKKPPEQAGAGVRGRGKDGGRGRGFNFQSGSLAGASGGGGSAFAGCSGFVGTITPGGTGSDGETGASGGEWGQDGGDTSNTGDGGDAGAAIFPSGFTVTGSINTNTIKGSY